MDDSLCGIGDDWVMRWGWTVVFGVFFSLHDLSIGVFWGELDIWRCSDYGVLTFSCFAWDWPLGQVFYTHFAIGLIRARGNRIFVVFSFFFPFPLFLWSCVLGGPGSSWPRG